MRADLGSVELIHLSHWHRDHSGGMLKAIEMIQEAKKAKGGASKPVTVDLHPNRPDYRGFRVGPPEKRMVFSLEADPSFAEIEAAGATVEKNSKTHSVLEDMFLISGEIPRVTPYEMGVKDGVRYSEATKTWDSDELIKDERFVMCNIKGTSKSTR